MATDRDPPKNISGNFRTSSDPQQAVPVDEDAVAAATPEEPKEPSEAFADAASGPTTSTGKTIQRPKEGFYRNALGEKTWMGTPQMEMGNSLQNVFMMLSMLFKDPEGFFSLFEFFFPKNFYTDPNQRDAKIDRLHEVAVNPNHPDRSLAATDFIQKHFPHLASGQDTLIRPELLEQLAKPGASSLKAHVNTTLAAVNDYNAKLAAGQIPLDANLVLNQIFQESRFNADAMGPQTRYGRAYGIAQFLPETGTKYGLSQNDLMNPSKALPAAVQHIGELTQKFDNQRLAMVAYNGGQGAVEWAAKELNKSVSDLTINDWMGYTDYLNQKHGEAPRNYWRNQTNEYVALSHSDYWSAADKQKSIALMEKLGLDTPEQAPENEKIVASTSALDNKPSGLG